MALQLAPGAATTHFNLANLLVKQHAYDEAMVHYSEALRLDPVFVEAHCNIASLLLETGRTKDAAAHYVAALQTKADHLPAIVSLAWIYATASSEAGSQHATEAVRWRSKPAGSQAASKAECSIRSPLLMRMRDDFRTL